MEHTIQTCMPWTQVEKVRVALTKKFTEEEIVDKFVFDATPQGFVKVEVKGNGAVLRDAAFSLDVFSMLD